MTDEAKRVAEEACTCISCTVCGGTGTVWFDFRGRYLGNSRCDDMDELELCDNCRGGIVEVCSRCELLEEMDHEQ